MKYACKAQQWDASIDNVNINTISLSEAILRSTEQGKGYRIYINIIYRGVPLLGFTSIFHNRLVFLSTTTLNTITKSAC